MNAVQFIENVAGIKMLDYQKKMVEYLEEHPDCKIAFPRGRRVPWWFRLYCVKGAYEAYMERLRTHIKELKAKDDYVGCENCANQIEPMRACEWLEQGGDGQIHLICPRWEPREEQG